MKKLAILLILTLSACGDDASAEDGGADGSGPDAPRSDAALADVSGPDAETPDAIARDTASPGSTLSERYPGDENIASDPSVIFHDDFESGWGQWNAPNSDTRYLTMESGDVANAGDGYLRSTVTFADLEENQYISAAPRYSFERRVDTVYWRFHVRFPNVAPNPHHWVRVSAGDESWESSGLANTVPPGERGFWFDFDINNDDVFNFYAYWHEMRSGNCNDGTTTPGCAGDQGHSNHYGNQFQPRGQSAYPRDEWVCIEMAAHANTPGTSDGWLAFFVDDVETGRFAPGQPEGTWLRSTFHEGGCDFSACESPSPFEGFDFRTSDDVGFKAIILDAYYQRDTAMRKREQLEERGLEVSSEQTILYDDVVVATERIGCRR